MFSKYLIPCTLDLDHFRGYIKLLDQEHYIEVLLKKPFETDSPNLTLQQRGLSLLTEPDLALLVKEYKPILNEKLSQFSDFDSFWFELEHLMERDQKQNSKDQVPKGDRDTKVPQDFTSSYEFYSTVVQDIEYIGNDRLIEVSPILDHIKFHLDDEKGRKHLISLSLPKEYPFKPPHLSADLPNISSTTLNLPPKLSAQESWTQYLIPELTKIIKHYNDFFDIMDELDLNTTILEPYPPTRKDIMRRIALQELCSLEITIDPDHPRAVPRYTLYGSIQNLKVLKSKLDNNLNQWDRTLTPKLNFEKVLDINFFNSTSQETSMARTRECGICYTYRTLTQQYTSNIFNINSPQNSPKVKDKSQAPTLVCDNTSCNLVFHHKCLLESIKSLPSSRRSYKVWFGQCPYCNEAITVTED